MSNLHNIRNEYQGSQLNESDMPSDPFIQFGHWLEEAISSGIKEPTAMTLATSYKDGRSSARMVLLKDFDKNGFTFYTNYKSKKGIQLIENPFAALLFFWPELERQVRIEGPICKVSELESNEYFSLRPKGNRIGAWASEQSSEIKNREELDSSYNYYAKKFQNENIPRPENWGGFRLSPDLIEFWQGRTNRLHDRIEYSFFNRQWKIRRLAP